MGPLPRGLFLHFVQFTRPTRRRSDILLKSNPVNIMEWSAIIRLQCKDTKGGKTLTGSRNAYCEFLKSRNELQAWADT